MSFFKNGYGEESSIKLCPTGRYYSTFEILSSSSLGSGSTFSKDQGVWRIQNNGGSTVLMLTSQTGEKNRALEVTAVDAEIVRFGDRKYRVEAVACN